MGHYDDSRERFALALDKLEAYEKHFPYYEAADPARIDFALGKHWESHRRTEKLLSDERQVSRECQQECSRLGAENGKLGHELAEVRASLGMSQDAYSELADAYADLEAKNEELKRGLAVQAVLDKDLQRLRKTVTNLQKDVDYWKRQNGREVEAHIKTAKERDRLRESKLGALWSTADEYADGIVGGAIRNSPDNCDSPNRRDHVIEKLKEQIREQSRTIKKYQDASRAASRALDPVLNATEE